MICPNITYKELTYLKLHQPEVYDNFMNMVEKWERRFGRNYFQSQPKYNVDYVRNIVNKKYIPQLLSEE
jgi:5,10-methylenetetrahydrofolate reductase